MRRRRRAERRGGLLLASSLLVATALACAPLRAPSEAPAAVVEPPNEAAEPPNPLHVGADALAFGSREAPVTLVAFLDFECPYCAAVFPTLLSLRQQLGPEQLRLAFRHAPLPSHHRARAAAKAAHAVGTTLGDAAFIRYAQWLFAQRGGSSDGLSDASLRRKAVELGLPGARFDELVASRQLEQVVDADLERLRRLGIDAVPAVFINGKLVLGARPLSDFRAIVEHEQRAARELRRRGLSAREVHAERVKVNLNEGAPDPEPAFVVPVGDSPALGSESAWVTVVEFADFECPYCARAHATMEQLMERFPGRIRWVVKNQPLPFHQQAVPAAIVLLEVYRQRGETAYWQAMRWVYTSAPLTATKLQELAEHFDLDAAATNEALALGPEHPQLLADRGLAEDLLARGTPHFFINGRRLAGAQPLQAFVERVEAELQHVEQTLSENARQSNVYAQLQAQAQPAPGLPTVEPPLVGEHSPVLGPEQAPITIQMFADFECGYCGRVMPTLRRLLERHEPQVRLVWRHLPLSFHANARLAAQAAMEARAQQGDAGFWAMASAFFGHEQAAEGSPSPWSSAGLRERAARVGLDLERFDAALADGRHLPAIEQDVQLAAELGLRGTPAFLINDRVLMGAQPERRFERAIQLAGEETRSFGE